MTSGSGRSASLHESHGGERGGFRPQNEGTEGGRAPAGGGDLDGLAFGPAAFGAEQERDGGGAFGAHQLQQGLAAGAFVEPDAETLAGGDRIRAVEEFAEYRQAGAAALLAGFEQDAAPAFHAFGCGFGQAVLAAFGDEGLNAADAEFGRLFEHPLKMIELEQARVEGDRVGRRARGEPLLDAERNDAFPGHFDGGEVEMFVVGDLKDLAGFDAEDARQMLGHLVVEFGHIPFYFRDEEKSSRHGRI